MAGSTKTHLAEIKVFTDCNTICAKRTRHIICFWQYHCNLFLCQSLKHFRSYSFKNFGSSNSLRFSTNAAKLDRTHCASTFYYRFRRKLNHPFFTIKKAQNLTSSQFFRVAKNLFFILQHKWCRTFGINKFIFNNTDLIVLSEHRHIKLVALVWNAQRKLANQFL